jgi:lipopolysaccharide/colanic/teichoic acid biosynthesis glycosyltransferase
MDVVLPRTDSERVPRATPAERRRPLGATDGASTVEIAIPTEIVRETELVITQRTQSVEVVPRPRSEPLNRAINVVLASLALIVLSPVLLLVALAVKLTSRGPILYSQTRVGLDRRWNRTEHLHDRRVRDLGGRIFKIYKFRSMYVDAERESGAVWATRLDPRVTPVGRVLRKLRLDELPQFINVLKGDMNIVGPRPERPSICIKLSHEIPEYVQRHRAKPGITGRAQVHQQYDECLDDVKMKVRYDLEYLERQGLAEDLKIMLKTVPVVLGRRGGW